MLVTFITSLLQNVKRDRNQARNSVKFAYEKQNSTRQKNTLNSYHEAMQQKTQRYVGKKKPWISTWCWLCFLCPGDLKRLYTLAGWHWVHAGMHKICVFYKCLVYLKLLGLQQLRWASHFPMFFASNYPIIWEFLFHLTKSNSHFLDVGSKMWKTRLPRS